MIDLTKIESMIDDEFQILYVKDAKMMGAKVAGFVRPIGRDIIIGTHIARDVRQMFPHLSRKAFIAHTLLHEINHAFNYEKFGHAYENAFILLEREYVADYFAVKMMQEIFGIDTSALFKRFTGHAIDELEGMLLTSKLVKCMDDVDYVAVAM